MLMPRWGRGTHCADCIRFVQTTTASQMTMHAVACPPRHSASQHQARRPAGGRPSPLFAPLVARHGCISCHAASGAIRDEAEAGGATSGSARRAGHGGLPLAQRGVGEDCLSCRRTASSAAARRGRAPSAVRRNAVDRHHRSPTRLRLIPAPRSQDKPHNPSTRTPQAASYQPYRTAKYRTSPVKSTSMREARCRSLGTSGNQGSSGPITSWRAVNPWMPSQ